jgi:ribonuclease HI
MRPTLAEALAAVAENEPLTEACRRLGCDRDTLVEVLRSGIAARPPAAAPVAAPVAAPAVMTPSQGPRPVLSLEPPAFRPPATVRERLVASPPPSSPSAPTSASAARAVVYSDGASRGNPGPAGAGAVVVFADRGHPTLRFGRFLGVQTNNVAEYQGVILGLERALEAGVREVEVRADSMLAMMQLKGEWKLKHEGLKPHFEKARALAARFERIAFRHIPREQNAAADEMSNRAIDERLSH